MHNGGNYVKKKKNSLSSGVIILPCIYCGFRGKKIGSITFEDHLVNNFLVNTDLPPFGLVELSDDF